MRQNFRNYMKVVQWFAETETNVKISTKIANLRLSVTKTAKLQKKVKNNSRIFLKWRKDRKNM